MCRHTASLAGYYMCVSVFVYHSKVQNSGNVTFHNAISHQRTAEAVVDKSKSWRGSNLVGCVTYELTFLWHFQQPAFQLGCRTYR